MAVCRSALVSAPEFAYRHVIEYSLAWSLLATGRIDEAVDMVDAFTAIPTGSQWGYVSSIVAHLVLAHRDGPEAVGGSLALVAREAVSRRPQISGEFLTAFAYLNHISGATERARFINDRTLSIALVPIQRLMLFAEDKVAGDQAIELIEAYTKEVPVLERHRRSTEFGPRLLAEELERWS
jgi:hypothetical protein